MAGGKGGSTTSQVQIPEYIEAAAQRNLNKAERISQLGYVPYYGPNVAALTPMQQASMQNVAGAAGAFGMAAPMGQDIYGMPAPTTYAGGVQGYSSAPMFEQAQAELAARRPAQKSYIDSFFIDPFTGEYGSNVQPLVDYTDYSTGAQQQREQQAFDLAMSGRASGSALSQAEFNQNLGIIGSVIGDPTYDGTRVLTAAEREAVAASPAAQLAQDTIYMNQLGNANNSFGDDISGLFGREPSFANPSSAGSYGGSLVTGELSGKFTPLPGFAGTVGDTLVSNLAPEYAMGKQTEQLAEAAGSTRKADGSYDIGSWFTDTSPKGTGTGPTNTALAEKVAGFKKPSSTSGRSSSSMYTGTSGNTTVKSGETLSLIAKKNNTTVDAILKANPDIKDANRIAAGAKINVPAAQKVDKRPAPTTSSTPKATQSAPQSDDIKDTKDCVVATHAVSSGAFTPSMKREAVVWCMHNLHDKWWGEAIRRGYRHLGRKKIEQGKAHEHYQEFRNYIDFASGKKRTIKGAIHFAARTVQFFAVGLVKGEA